MYSKSTRSLPIGKLNAKARASIGLREIVENASNRRWEANKKKEHRIDGKHGFYRYDVKFSFIHNWKEHIYKGILLIRNDLNYKKYLYDVLDIKKVGTNPLPLASNPKGSAMFGSPDSIPTNSITPTKKNVKTVSNNIPKGRKSIQNGGK